MRRWRQRGDDGREAERLEGSCLEGRVQLRREIARSRAHREITAQRTQVEEELCNHPLNQELQAQYADLNRDAAALENRWMEAGELEAAETRPARRVEERWPTALRDGGAAKLRSRRCRSPALVWFSEFSEAAAAGHPRRLANRPPIGIRG